METRPWNEYKKAINNNKETREKFAKGEAVRPFHIGRIAYFVVNGVPNEEKHQILLSVQAQTVRLREGFHRMAAAFVRGDQRIPALIAGKPEEILRLLPGAALMKVSPFARAANSVQPM